LVKKLGVKPLDESTLQSWFSKVYPEFIGWMERMGKLCVNYSKEERENYKTYIQQSKYFQQIQESPWSHQIINKPRGYAGDSDMMKIIYDDQFQGSTNFGKLYTKLTNAVEGSQAVRNRRHFLYEKIRKVASGQVLSIAAGPAYEIEDILKTEQSRNFHFLALDHDIITLRKYQKQATNFQYGIVNAFHLLKGNFKYLIPKSQYMDKVNPKRDLKGWRKLLLPLKYQVNTLQKQQFDLVYAAGLYDYIQTTSSPEKGSVALTKNLFELVKPEGQLIIGNYTPTIPIGTRWYMEYVCDWNLIYRTDEEILAFKNTIPSDQIANYAIEAEATGITKFLVLEKK